jgi:retron-type reverse transcriptase
MISPPSLSNSLAATLLAGVWTHRAIARRAQRFLGPAAGTLLQDLIAEIIEQSPRAYPPSPRQLEAILLGSTLFRSIHWAVRMRPLIGDIIFKPPIFAPLPSLLRVQVPPLATAGELAQWLDVPMAQLEWLADTRRRHRDAAGSLQHYTYIWVRRRVGPPRLIEAPKRQLKAIQRKILSEILDRLAAHASAHGFVKGRSVLTSTHLHAGEPIVVTIDLKSFFPSTNLGRVYGIFRSLGFPYAVARLLTGLCSTTTPACVLAEPTRPDWMARRHYANPHLPQGAPTSPALANLCAFRLDCRLSALAARLGARYTRYADDLAFSGDETLAGRHRAFVRGVGRIIRDEGFAVNERKTRVMRASVRQRITGIVVNEHINIPREAYDRLKATLHNCLRHGPAGQNRAGHRDFRADLDGRIAWVESVNPSRGRKLRRLFEQIVW